VIYILANRVRELLYSRPDVWRDIVSSSTKYDGGEQDGIILGVDETRLPHTANQILSRIMTAQPEITADPPRQSQRIIDGHNASVAAEDDSEAAEVERTIAAYFKANPWMYSDANADILRGKLRADESLTAEEAAAEAGLCMGPQAHEALLERYDAHPEIKRCDANDEIILLPSRGVNYTRGKVLP
jgi:hypothetical protein